MKYFILCVLASAFVSCGRLIPNEVENGKLLGVMPMQYGRASYQITTQLPTSRDDLFRQARRWAAFHVSDPANALSLGDNMLGDVISSGRLDPLYYQTKKGPLLLPSITYAASIECLDGSYRLTFTNFRYDLGLKTPGHGVEYRFKALKKARAKQQLELIDERISRIINNLQTFIASEIREEVK